MLMPRGIKRYKSRGKWFTYHRATGARIEAEYGSAAFILEVERLDARVRPRAEPQTIGAAIKAYRSSLRFRELAAATRFSYGRAFAEIEEGATVPVAKLTTAMIVGARDQIEAERGRWMANYYVTVLAIILDYARERGWIQTNPAAGIRRIRAPRNAQKANRPWTPMECRTVLDAAPAYLAVPIGLAMFAGFRKGDVLTIELAAVGPKGISHKTAKRSVDVVFPIHPTLANILSQAPRHKARTIAANSRGERWTESGFNSTFSKLVRKLEEAGKVAPGLTMHGLRHTVGTRLVEAGADLDMVQRLLGQQSAAMARHYSKTADVSEAATALVGKMKVVG